MSQFRHWSGIYCSVQLHFDSIFSYNYFIIGHRSHRLGVLIMEWSYVIIDPCVKVILCLFTRKALEITFQKWQLFNFVCIYNSIVQFGFFDDEILVQVTGSLHN